MGTKLLNHLGAMYIQRSDVYEVNIDCSHAKLLVPKGVTQIAQ